MRPGKDNIVMMTKVCAILIFLVITFLPAIITTSRDSFSVGSLYHNLLHYYHLNFATPILYGSHLLWFLTALLLVYKNQDSQVSKVHGLYFVTIAYTLLLILSQFLLNSTGLIESKCSLFYWGSLASLFLFLLQFVAGLILILKARKILSLVSLHFLLIALFYATLLIVSTLGFCEPTETRYCGDNYIQK